MTKKSTFTLLVLLIVSAFVFVSCNEEKAVPGPAPTPKEAVVNELGEESANLVYNGDFNNGDDSDIENDGSTSEVQAGVGIDGSAALYVYQDSAKDGGEDVGWGEVMFEATKLYGRGKSYYVEASFKKVGYEGLLETPNFTAHIDFTVVSGAGYDKYGKTYNIPGQYDFDWLSDDDASLIFERKTSGGDTGVDISDGEWHTVSAILDAETIDKMIETQTSDHGTGETQETLFYMAFTFFVGNYEDMVGKVRAGQDGYQYYLDNVKIIDLNDELERTGKTWVDPTAVDPDDEE